MYTFWMHHKPFIVKNLIKHDVLKQWQAIIEEMKSSKLLQSDTIIPNRKYFFNHPFFQHLHQNYFTPLALKHFKEDLKPTYSLAIFYEQGKGFLPLHADKPQCYLTVDLCLNQRQQWPIFINDEDVLSPDQFFDFEKISEEQKDQYRNNSKPYYLNPGDAIFYSGTQCAHWRNTIQEDNFCDVILFHFEKYKDSF